jgi:hypoxanthine-guanine phosphoribosyltransferase
MKYAKHLKKFFRLIGEKKEGGVFNALINWQKFRGRNVNFNAVFLNIPLPFNYVIQFGMDYSWSVRNMKEPRLTPSISCWQITGRMEPEKGWVI